MKFRATPTGEAICYHEDATALVSAGERGYLVDVYRRQPGQNAATGARFTGTTLGTFIGRRYALTTRNEIEAAILDILRDT